VNKGCARHGPARNQAGLYMAMLVNSGVTRHVQVEISDHASGGLAGNSLRFLPKSDFKVLIMLSALAILFVVAITM
jgi:hypothetical protein